MAVFHMLSTKNISHSIKQINIKQKKDAKNTNR